MANSPPNGPKRLVAGSNFSLRLPKVVNPDVLAELNRHRKNKNFNSYAVALLLWAVEQDIKGRVQLNRGNDPTNTENPDVQDIEKTVEMALRKLLGNNLQSVLSGALSDNLATQETAPIETSVATKQAVEVQPTPVVTENQVPVETAKNDPKKRKRNRDLARGIHNSAMGFGDGEG